MTPRPEYLSGSRWPTLEILAAQWWAEWRAEECDNASDFVSKELEMGVDDALELIDALISAAADRGELRGVGAGPLEDLLSHHGHAAKFLDQVVDRVQTVDGWSTALTCVRLTEGVPDYVRRRLASLGARDVVAEHGTSDTDLQVYFQRSESAGLDVPQDKISDGHDQLEDRRRNLDRQRQQLRDDWLAIVETTAWSATDDEHDPEGATIAYERSRVASQLAQVDAELAAIALAFKRVGAGTYGICVDCGAHIASERLAVRPAAERCISCAGRLPA